MTLEKDGVRLTFPEDWDAREWDTSNSFHSRHVKRTRNNLRSVDIVAFDPISKELWLIEIKDYSHHKRTDPTPLQDTLAEKAIDTMGSVHVAARTGLTDAHPDVFAARSIVALSERVHFVYIGMEPANPTKLWGTGINTIDLRIALRQRIRCIDAHPLVVDTAHWPRELQWTAEKL